MPTTTVSTAPAACAWCGRPLNSGAEVLKGRVRCRGCGAATTSPWPTERQLEASYGDWYRPPSGRFGGFGDALLRRSRGALARRVDRIAPSGAVLDVGCGDGALLDALSTRGRGATGLERASSRSDVLDIDIHEVGGRWAAVIFWHSLEHLSAPGDALCRAAELLIPGGVVFVAIPNADSLQARLFGDRWFALDLPRHLIHVSADTLIAALRDLDLEPERISHLRGGQVVFGWLHGLVGALPGHPDLYDAIRRPEARRRALSKPGRAAALAAGALLSPVAAAAALAESGLRKGGSVYVEARRA